MAAIGSLGDIVFTVSDDLIETLSNVQWSGSARYGTHKRHLINAMTEFTGIEPDTMSFDMTLSAYLGVDVMTELNKIWTYERTGQTLPLFIGEKGYGKYRWTIESHKIKMSSYDNKGNVSGVTVSVNLLEYVRK